MSNSCWIRSAKGLHGPYSPDLLPKLAENGLLKPDMDISSDGRTWYRADSLPGIFTAPARSTITLGASAAKPTPRTPAPKDDPAQCLPGTEINNIDQRIEALPVSEKWKRRFRELEADPRKVSMNSPAFFFCVFYYLAKGLWKKGLSLQMWLMVFHLTADIVAAAMGYYIPVTISMAITATIFVLFANHDVWRKELYNETFWQHPAARWGVWLGVPALIGLVVFTVSAPNWLSLPQCSDSGIKSDVRGLIRQSEPFNLDGKSWKVANLTNVFELGRRPLPEFRHCHARLHLTSTAGESHSYSIEYWLHFDAQGELRIAIK